MIDGVIARLRPQDGWTALKSVAGALDLADIADNHFAVPPANRPAAYVMLAGEQAGGNEMDTGPSAQIVTQTVSIAFCIGGGAQVGKVAAGNEVMALRDRILARLLGWSPDGMGVLVYGGLAMLALQPRAVWFQMSFTRRIGVRSELQPVDAADLDAFYDVVQGIHAAVETLPDEGLEE